MDLTNPPMFLEPGKVQLAQDVRFDTGDASKRDGFRRVINQADGPTCLLFASPTGNAPAPFVRIPDNSGWRQQTNMTIEIVFRPDSVSGNQTLLAKGRFAATVDAEYEFRLNGTTLTFDVYGNTGAAIETTLTSPTVLIAGTTYYAAFVKQGTAIRLYLGTLTGASAPTLEDSDTVDSTDHTTTYPLTLGCRMNFGDGNCGADFVSGGSRYTSRPFNGRLAELRIWAGTFRTLAQLQANYNQWLGSSDTSGLAGYWHLNEGTGTIVSTSPVDTTKQGSLHPVAPHWTTSLVGDTTVRGAVILNDPTYGYAASGNQSFDDAWTTDLAPSDGSGGASTTTFWAPLWSNFSTMASAGTDFTLEFKVKFNTVTTPQVLFSWSRYDATTPDHYLQVRLETSGGNPVLYGIAKFQGAVGSGAADHVSFGGNTTIVAGTTYHVAVTRHYTTAPDLTWKLWLNGVSEATTSNIAPASAPTVSQNSSITRVTIGASGIFFGNVTSTATYGTPTIADRLYASADATFDEMRVWTVDRSIVPGVASNPSSTTTVNKILELKDTSLFDAAGERTGLIGYFPMDDDEIDQRVQQSTVIRDDVVSRVGFLAYPATNPPCWASGIVTKTTLDDDVVTINAKPPFVLGLANFTANGGTQYLVKKQGTELYTLASGATAWTAARPDRTPAASTFTSVSSELEFFAGYRNRLYSGNGTDLLLRFDGTTYGTAGVFPPRLPPLRMADNDSGAAGSLALATTYEWIYTAYNSQLGLESNPSPALRYTTTNAGTSRHVQLQLRGVGDPQVDRLRIYRTFGGTGVPLTSVYFLAGEVANPTNKAQGTTTFVDTNADAGLSAVIAIDPTNLRRDPPPRGCRSLLVFKNRLYATGSADRPQDVFFSDIDRPDAFPINNYLRLEDKDGSPVTGLAALYDVGVAFKANSIWHWSTQGEAFALSKIHDGIGCIAPGSVCNLDQNTIFFVSARGPYLYDGQNLRYIGKEIEADFQLWPKSRIARVQACYFRKRGQVLLAASRSSTTKNDVVYVCEVDPVQGEFRNTDEIKWSRYTINAQCILDTIDSNGDERVFFGDDFGYVDRLENATSDGPNILLLQGGESRPNSLSGSPTSGTTTTLTNTGANWANVADGMRGYRIRITLAGMDTDTVILSNATTTLSLGALLGVAPTTADTYAIGYIDYNLLTREVMPQDSGYKTDVRHVRLLTNGNGASLDVDAESDGGAIVGTTHTKTTTVYTNFRTALARGRSSAIRIRNDQPDVALSIKGFALDVEPGQDT